MICSSLLLVCLLGAAVVAQQCREDGIYGEKFDKCYYVYDYSVTFAQATSVCAALRGSIVSLHSVFEQAYVYNMAKQAMSTEESDGFWIGLTDAAGTGTWTWADGQESAFRNWDTGYPTTTAGATCAKATLATGKWQNSVCNDFQMFICQGPATPITTPVIPPTTENFEGWIYYNVTDHWYKVSFTWGSWAEVEESCVSDASHLVSIHSDDENKLVVDLMAWKIPMIASWIGLHRVNGLIVWSDGSEVDYSNFANPENTGNCVQIHSSDFGGKWDPFGCNDSRYGVCKKPNRRH